MPSSPLYCRRCHSCHLLLLLAEVFLLTLLLSTFAAVLLPFFATVSVDLALLTFLSADTAFSVGHCCYRRYCRRRPSCQLLPLSLSPSLSPYVTVVTAIAVSSCNRCCSRYSIISLDAVALDVAVAVAVGACRCGCCRPVLPAVSLRL